MFGFDKSPLGNVTREEFNTYRMELMSRLDSINRILSRLVDIQRAEQRADIEQRLEAQTQQLQPGEPEREEEENDERRGVNPLITVAAGALSAAAVGPIGDLLRSLGILQDRREENPAESPEFRNTVLETELAQREISDYEPELEDRELGEREIEEDVRRTNRTILDRLGALFSNDRDRDRDRSESSSTTQTIPSPSPTSTGAPERVPQQSPRSERPRTFQQPSTQVANAINSAADKTGVDRSTMMAFARIESGFDPNARARTSSASGLYQFIDSTWDSIYTRYRNQFPELERGRMDPEANAIAGGLLMRENADWLRARGYPVNPGTLYLMHFAGPAAAQRLLSAPSNASAASIVPRAARSNPSIFYDNGRARTVGEVLDNLSNRVTPATEHYERQMNLESPQTNTPVHRLSKAVLNNNTSSTTVLNNSRNTTVNRTRTTRNPPEHIALNPRNPNSSLSGLSELNRFGAY